MGNCFSDPSAKKESKKGGHVLGSAPASSQPTQTPANTSTPHTAASADVHTTGDIRPGQMLGDGFEDSNRNRDPREMARQAAEERIKANSQRGVNKSTNAKAGQLSAKLDAERRKPMQASSPREEENMMDPRRYD
ncbi:hypothetical protein QFC22_002391 [Naganishia vaughanmartiniae]|uniref:Uncharacterized protein n=1 Tax=Naganishia vaughanmartiniae TaxID=1424756 RepID=A0ACC2XEF5_9TREE|nr:hypothetical protein QFC22_002391 [Naganishia vaughanmartiniae]